MALFTDADIVTLNDLLPFESSLVQIASSHGIDVQTKIELSISTIQDKLMLWLVNVGASDPQWINRRLLGLSTVVVTPTLHKWLCFDSLSRFFAEAYNTQLNTRFEGKWTEYKQNASDAAEMVFMSGIGIVYKPLPRPGMPVVSAGTGDPSPEALFVQAAWVDAAGNESALSPVNGLILSGVLDLTVAMKEGVVLAPPSAIGWNLYASNTEMNLTRQNTSLMTIGQPWHLPTSGLVNGPPALNGQVPDYYITLSRPVQRG